MSIKPGRSSVSPGLSSIRIISSASIGFFSFSHHSRKEYRRRTFASWDSQSLYLSRFCSVGLTRMKSLPPDTMWYHTEDPAMSICQSVYEFSGPEKGLNLIVKITVTNQKIFSHFRRRFIFRLRSRIFWDETLPWYSSVEQGDIYLLRKTLIWKFYTDHIESFVQQAILKISRFAAIFCYFAVSEVIKISKKRRSKLLLRLAVEIRNRKVVS